MLYCAGDLQVISSHLQPKYIQFPVGNNLSATVQGFLDEWGIPQCAGSIDGSHIPVKPTAMNHTCYYNHKGWYSIVLQAIVDITTISLLMCMWAGQVVCMMHVFWLIHLYMKK